MAILKLKFNKEYRSITWWVIALFSYLSILFWKYIGNHIHLRKSKSMIYNMIIYVDKKQNILYKKLNKKYPNEFTWIEKYLDTNIVHTISELGMIAQSELFSLYSVWYYDLTLEDCKEIILNGFGFTTSIYLKTGFKHSVSVIGFDDLNNLLIIHDPLGDYFSNYIIWYGAYVEFPYDEFLKISTGNPINAQIFFPNKNIAKKVLKNINKKKYAYP